MKTLSQEEVQAAAVTLLNAEKEGKAIERITALFGDFQVADAYRVQRAGFHLRLPYSSQVGWKMGLTSESKRKQMSLDSSIFGYLLRETLFEGTLSPRGMIHPKAEPEIAFRLKKSLKGKVDRARAQDAIGSYCSAIEVIDSRYIGFKYFSLPDVIADNCSSGKFILGQEVPYQSSLNLADLKMKFSVGGSSQEVLASEISGDPINSLLQLTDMLSEHNLEIPEGAIILAGAATPAIALEKGQEFLLEVDTCAPLRFSVTA